MGSTSFVRTPWKGRSRRLVGLCATIVGMVALLSALGLGFAAVRSAHAAGSTVTVCATGCDYPSIDAAVTASNAAPGSIATIQVKAGTYNEPDFTITSPVNLEGASAGAVTIKQPLSAGGDILIKPTSAGNTTISGFTIEGNGTNAGVRPILATAKDTNASDTVTISDDTFVETASTGTSCPGTDASSTDSCQPYDFSIGFYNSGNGTSNAATVVTGNTFTGLWQAVLSENAPGTLTVTDNQMTGLLPSTDVLSGQTIPQDPEAVFDFAHSTSMTVDVTQTQTFSANTFSGYAGLGIGVYAGFDDNGKNEGTGSFSTISITNNAFNFSGTLNQSDFDKPQAIRLEGDESGTFGAFTITGNVAHLVPGDDGILVQGDAFKGGVVISSGTISGNAISSTTSTSTFYTTGINIGFVDSTTPITVDSNLLSIAGASGGDYGTDLFSGFNATNTFTAAQNCFLGTLPDTYGAEDITSELPSETNNWWGEKSGPKDASNNPSGTGTNADGVTDEPFLTSAPAPCSGPTISGAKASSNPATTGTSLTLSGTANGFWPVVSAQYSVDGGSYKSMNASNGSFGATTQGLKATLSAFAGAGTHTICERATDSQGFTGPASCFSLTVAGTGLSGNGNPPSAPQTAQAPSTNGSSQATNGSANGNAPHTPAQPKTVAGTVAPSIMSGVPLWLLTLLVLVAFALIGSGTVLLLRGRGTDGR